MFNIRANPISRVHELSVVHTVNGRWVFYVALRTWDQRACLNINHMIQNAVSVASLSIEGNSGTSCRN